MVSKSPEPFVGFWLGGRTKANTKKMITFIKKLFSKKQVVQLTDTQQLVLENICYLTDGNLANDVEVENAVYAIHQCGMFDTFDVNCVANHIKNQARFK